MGLRVMVGCWCGVGKVAAAQWWVYGWLACLFGGWAVGCADEWVVGCVGGRWVHIWLWL